jgi:two-component system, chemotaxis family, protein-glutamate methylesterase/glutaminase
VIRHDIVAIGTSAGGHQALSALAAALPADLPAALVVAMHLPLGKPSMLADLLARSGPLPAAFAVDGERISPGRIYVAPPDCHLLTSDGGLLLRHTPRENGWRPAIDPLFRSVAVSHGGRAIGMLLTGLRDDGVSGLVAIRRCGGLTVVQDPRDAEFPDLPLNALHKLPADHVVPVAAMGPLLGKLVDEPATRGLEPSPELRLEVEIAAGKASDAHTPDKLGDRSVLTCPECHGVLWRVRDSDMTRYRCHVGHAFSLDELSASKKNELENALYVALRAIEERLQLLRSLCEDAREHDRGHLVQHWQQRIDEYQGQAQAIRNILFSRLENDRP